MSKIVLCMAQINALVGDIPGNTDKVLEQAQQALQQHQADAVIFPELTLIGCPPEDLLLRPSLQLRIDRALHRLMDAALPLAIIVGYPRVVDGQLHNMAGVIVAGQLLAEYSKQHLSDRQMFDEQRYFTTGNKACVFSLKGLTAALSLGEDIVHRDTVTQARDGGAKLLLNLSASAFCQGESRTREQLLQQYSREEKLAIVSTNMVGGQDEWVFDGGSLAVNQAGQLCARAVAFEPALVPVGIGFSGDVLKLEAQSLAPPLSDLAQVYQALVTGLRDYVQKNGFKGVLLGLSGGIDSALTLAIAVDALGADKVETVMMPFRYTSDLSIADALEQTERMGVQHQSISIEPLYDAFMTALASEFSGTSVDTTEQNLQARCRAVLLMAISNKKGYLVLTTGNKSELAVGYSTLYGDMAGGFDALKDTPKTLVFNLAKYRNREQQVIPESVITRPPSAELAPDQEDQDSLPPYEILDAILALYVEQDYSAAQIIAEGFNPEEVTRVIRLVDINEYKRRQAPIGPRISARGFGQERRYPITSGWQAAD